MLANDLVRTLGKLFRYDHNLVKWIEFGRPTYVPLGVPEIPSFNKRPILTFQNSNRCYDIQTKSLRDIEKLDYVSQHSQLELVADQDLIDKGYNKIRGFIRKLTPDWDKVSMAISDILVGKKTIILTQNVQLGNILTAIFENMYSQWCENRQIQGSFYSLFMYVQVTDINTLRQSMKDVFETTLPSVIVADFPYDFSHTSNLTYLQSLTKNIHAR